MYNEKHTEKTACFTQIQFQFYLKQKTVCRDYVKTKIK